MRAVVKAGVVALVAMLAVGPVSSAMADDTDVQTQAAKQPVTVSVPVRVPSTRRGAPARAASSRCDWAGELPSS